jgi:Protein of unknown function (DUF1559)
MSRFVFLLGMAMVFASAARAADAADLSAVAPVIDDQTVLVARIDLPRIDVDAWLDLVEPFLPRPAEVKQADRREAKAWLEAYRKKGGREVYIVYGLNDVPGSACLLTPVGDELARNDLAELLRLLVDEKVSARIGKLLAVGNERALKKLQARKAARRPDLEEAFAASGDGLVRVALGIPADVRRVYEELVPELPKEVGGGSIQILTRGFKWAALSLDAPPKIRARAIVQAADAGAADRLNALVVRAVQTGPNLLLQERDAPDIPAFPQFVRRMAELLTPRVEKDRLVVDVNLGAELPALAKLTEGVSASAERARSMNNLKQLGLALHNYHDVHGSFPTNILDKEGKPLLSWRVAVLPYIEEQPLYQQFHLDEPWDSEHNKKLIGRMPKTYRSPRQSSKLTEKTTYLAPFGKGLMWDEPKRAEVNEPSGKKVVIWKGTEIKEVFDGTSNTILLVEADDDRAAIWTKPDDYAVDPQNPAKGLLKHYADGVLVLLADGSVRMMSKKMKPEGLYTYFTRAGGEVAPE